MKRLMLALDIVVVMFLVPIPAYADHEGPNCYDYECSEQEYDQWNNDQRNHNGRNRGAFSPGPFDDSPVDIRDNNVCISPDCSRDGKQEEQR